MSTSGFNGQGILHEPHPATDASPHASTDVEFRAARRLLPSNKKEPRRVILAREFERQSRERTIEIALAIAPDMPL
jgi:hypothetical protein